VRTEDGHLRQTRFGLLWVFVFVSLLNLQRKAEECSLLKVKVEVTAYYRPLRPLREIRGISLLFLVNLGTLHGGGCSTPRPGRLYPGKDPVPIVQEAGWASEPVWIGAENLATTGIRCPDVPARSESLYRLSHPGSEGSLLKVIIM
jgi:hypothetical protein